MTVLVIRHAHAGVRERWPYDDGQRPLSEQGRVEAKELPHHLSGYPLDRIISSPLVRCTETVQELARDRGLEVELDDRLIEGTALAEVWELVREMSGQHVALCTHGDLIQQLVRDLYRRKVDMPGDPAWAKGSTWVLELDGHGEVARADYLPPPT
ncbi:MAG: phosphoglycerate mutase family protein [Nitriliruptorales bacterium]|nr:phosphoglycerate mutase family protein [Nitriliruptorales bacterium]